MSGPGITRSNSSRSHYKYILPCVFTQARVDTKFERLIYLCYRKGLVSLVFPGPVLAINCCLITLTMLRRMMSRLRKTRFAFYLPSDHYLNFHIIMGYVIFVFGFLHGLGFTLHFSKLTISTRGKVQYVNLISLYMQ